MRKLFLLTVVAAAFASCNDNKVASMSTSNDSATKKEAENVTYPYAINYSSKFEIASSEYSQKLLQLWKAWDNGSLSDAKDMFADSVELHFANGMTIHTSRDSAVAMAQNVRNTFSSSVSTVDAVMATHSIDKDENWALVWGKEVDTDKAGKKDSSYLQESWRFNKAGKADLLYQYRAGNAPQMKK